ncbi:alpha/beta fold hydrolase [Aequorivita echinoideorum]|uniref:hypothetical protein n=1 Tax=Aequorivita echinoideorum TaxID=1549647 RepID=UPI001FED2A16|nr:hypothetical protein [Aequorivita echinoideorum]
MKYILSFLLLCFGITTAQKGNFNSEDLKITPLIDGTLIIPEQPAKMPLAIIIGGSGPTDRNGNQMMMVNNSLKFLAEGLYAENIASFRYDKRIVKQMKSNSLNEENIDFSQFIADAEAVISYLKKTTDFQKFTS